MAVRGIAVHLSARVDSYVAAMRAASASTLGFSRATERNLTQVGTSMMSVGRKMSTFVTAPLALMGAGAVKAAVDWESAWAGVTKTVNGTESEMAALEQGLRDLTDVLPATHSEIAAVAEAAGALGIAQEDILQFTKTMIDLGETTNLTADQAATSIAQLMNIMSSAPGDVDNLASALVHLGNTGASTEDEILDMAHRIAGAGQMIGLSEAEVLGFAAAMADLGIKSEQGGTAIQRVFLKMHSAVLSGSADLTEFASVAGMSAQQFASMWESDPARAITLFIDGLGALDAAGGDVTTMLRGVGINGQLAQQVLFRMMGDVGGLADALDRSNMSWEQNVALINEANKRYDTAAARFEIVRNKIVDLFIDLGNMMLPAIEQIAEVIGNLAEGFQALPAPVQVAVGGFLALVAAIGPMLFIGGALIKNLTSITSLFGIAASAANPYIAALIGIGLAVTAAVTIFGMFGASQREGKARTDEVQQALIGATDEAWNYAAAAAGASGDVDGFAVAQRALSLALTSSGEDGAKLTKALGAIGAQAEDALPILIAIGRDPVEAMASLAEQSGLTATEAQLLANAVNSTDDAVGVISKNLYDAARAMGYTHDEALALVGALEPAAAGFEEIQDQVEKLQEGGGFGDLATDFLNIASAANEEAEALINEAEARAKANDIADSSVDTYVELMGIIGEMGSEERAAALESLGLAQAAETTSGELGELTAEAISGADAFAQLADAFAIARDQALTGGVFNQGAVEAKAWRDAVSGAIDDVVNVQGNYISTQDDIHKANYALQESFKENGKAITGHSEAAIANRDMMGGYVDAIYAHAKAQLESGVAVKDVTATFYENRDGMVAAAIAAGYEEDEVWDLVDALGAADGDWETIIRVSGNDIAMQKIEALLLELEGVDDEYIAEVNAHLLTEGAWATYDWMVAGMEGSSIGVPVHLQTAYAYSQLAALRDKSVIQVSRGGRAMGGFSDGPQVDLWGEAGTELMMPLTRPGLMQDYLRDPRAAPLWQAMSKLMPHPHGGQGSTYVVNVHNNGRDLTPADVARAIEMSRTAA